ncbi:hypothetical protein BHYA_0005g00430 [Botrytis hyacinthi]|uniref:Uncharacterized protein n=1 Tax=Botrytis hyacinthi TaxID=278943 RepID=A0A4Z1H1R5_9HELO|nr:hypothetical protein BHYA_0005g00430 [Botrytis hyacinthi]
MPSPFIGLHLSSVKWTVVNGICIKSLQCIYSEFLASVDYDNLDNMHKYMEIKNFLGLRFVELTIEKMFTPTICIVTVNISLSDTSVWIPPDSKLDLDIRAAARSLGD